MRGLLLRKMGPGVGVQEELQEIVVEERKTETDKESCFVDERNKCLMVGEDGARS